MTADILPETGKIRGHFCSEKVGNGQIFLATACFGLMKSVQMAKKSGQMAIFILKVATRKPLYGKGFEQIWPNAHFFLQLIAKIKISILYIIANKSGQMATRQFSGKKRAADGLRSRSFLFA